MRRLRSPNEWGLILHSLADGTRPTTAMGAAVTPAQNAYGTYVTLITGANLTDDVYEIEVNINSVFATSAARDGVVSLGLDPAGGTTFTSIVDLIAGQAFGYNGGGVWYKFPLYIKAGTSIGVAAAVNSATLTAIRVFCRCRCRPSRPDMVYAGSYIDSFGVSLATSSGTVVTEGLASEGAWTQLGSTLSRPCWYWEFGFGQNQAVEQNAIVDVDIGIGDGTNKKIAISNQSIQTTTSETLLKAAGGEYAYGAIGDGVYARAQTSNAAVSTHSIAAYGVGG